MQIPNQFKLFSQTWTIRPGTAKELPNELGMCYSDTNEILLATDQSADSIRHTLMHELVHCIEQKLAMNLSEQQVDTLALGFVHLFLENPALLPVLINQEQYTTEQEDAESR